MKECKKFIDTDGNFSYGTVDFSGPEGYVIVIPEGNVAASRSAEYLQKYYSESLNIHVEIVTDTKAEVEKEILIGKTNRTQSSKELAAASLEVVVADQKLVMNGGHDVTVDSAVKKYVRLAPKNKKACVFKLDTDFVATKPGGYEYVWGDEFEGTELDRTKWAYTTSMEATSPTILRASSEDVVAVEDGRLKLNAILCCDSDRGEVKYKVPLSVSTFFNMAFTYGYVEIRARVPFQNGAWPSFWMGHNAGLPREEKRRDYAIEVDVFENFGSTNRIVPNIHKHYRGRSVQWPGEKNVYSFSNEDGMLDQEYHIYGCELTPTEISMYVDGVKYQTFDITKSFDDNPDMSGFHASMNLLFNNHLFVEGANTASWAKYLVNDEELPTEYYIDYIRLYQKPGQGKLWLNETIRNDG